MDHKERNEILTEILKDFSISTQNFYKKRVEFDSILLHQGKNVTNRPHLVEYSENVVESIEKEIEGKLKELRGDFPNIDKFTQELRGIIAKEWLASYQDKYLQSIDEFTKTKSNENIVFIDTDPNVK